MNQKPSIGRIVHYLQPETEIYVESTIASMITQVHDDDQADGRQDDVGLVCFYPADTVERRGTQHKLRVPFSDVPKPGHWSWPPRV